MRYISVKDMYSQPKHRYWQLYRNGYLFSKGTMTNLTRYMTMTAWVTYYIAMDQKQVNYQIVGLFGPCSGCWWARHRYTHGYTWSVVYSCKNKRSDYHGWWIRHCSVLDLKQTAFPNVCVCFISVHFQDSDRPRTDSDTFQICLPFFRILMCQPRSRYYDHVWTYTSLPYVNHYCMTQWDIAM